MLSSTEEEEQQVISLITRAETMLQMLQSDKECSDIVCINALWHPIQCGAPDLSGERIRAPRNMHQVLRSFGEALELLTYARKLGRREVQGQHTEESVSSATQPTEEDDENKGMLSAEEFDAALTWIKNHFHEHYMENKKVKKWYSWVRADPNKLTEAEKAWTDNQFQTAFRKWATKLVADYNLFIFVLQHGICNPEERPHFVEAVLREKEQASGDARHAGNTKDPNEDVRRRTAALQARLMWKKAQKLHEWGKEDTSRWNYLEYADKCLLAKFINGYLLKDRKNADEAYGHGDEVETLSLQDRARLRAWSTNALT